MKEQTTLKSLSKKKVAPKDSGWEYFWLALYAFAGLGIEMIYAFLLEPAIYGYGIEHFTTGQSVLHWVITCITWLTAAFLINRYSVRKLDFDLLKPGKKVSPLSLIICLALIVLVTVSNWLDLGTLKVYNEFVKLGFVKFVFQHLYYFCETILFTLIIVFGQTAMEKWFRRENFPFGGIVVGITWGLAHWFTKGSLLVGLEGILVGFLFGSIYLILGKDVRKTYFALAIAFIL